MLSAMENSSFFNEYAQKKQNHNIIILPTKEINHEKMYNLFSLFFCKFKTNPSIFNWIYENICFYFHPNLRIFRVAFCQWKKKRGTEELFFISEKKIIQKQRKIKWKHFFDVSHTVWNAIILICFTLMSRATS